MLPAFYQFKNRTKVIFGEDVSLDFSHELGELGAEKYFLVSDKIIQELGLAKQVKDGLVAENIHISGEFYDVPQDASITCVKEVPCSL